MDWRQFITSIAVEREPDEPNLIKNILIVGMILSEDESNEPCLDVIDVSLFKFPCLKVSVDIGV